jgi:hypothetical protein
MLHSDPSLRQVLGIFHFRYAELMSSRTDLRSVRCVTPQARGCFSGT